MKNSNNRRDFLKIAGITAIAPYLFGNSETDAAVSPTFVRKDVATLGMSDPILVSYRTAVAAMKALPTSDPRNWTNVASIHQNGCPHGNWFFLPWHRAYLYYFEKLIRQFSGNKNFALPYWNWTVNPQIPAAFWQTDSLNDPNRDVTSASTIPAEFVGPTVISDIMRLSLFVTFGSGASTHLRDRTTTGQLEGTPHNNVHGFIGGDMGDFMSPLDPIFWLHHANVDRIWAMWNESGKRNTNNVGWRNFDMAPEMGTKFVNFDKTLINSALVSNFTTTRALKYRYDTQTSPLNLLAINSVSTQFLSNKTISFITPNQKEITTSTPLQVDMMTSPEFVQKSAKVVRKKGKVEEDIIVLNVTLKKPIPENALVKVFINNPDLNVQTPITDPHYVASFCFFATTHGDHGGMQNHTNHVGDTSDKVSYVFELNKTLDNLNQLQKSVEEKITVQLLVTSRDANTTFKLIPDSFKVSVLKRA
jgi:tyrosinase